MLKAESRVDAGGEQNCTELEGLPSHISYFCECFTQEGLQSALPPACIYFPSSIFSAVLNFTFVFGHFKFVFIFVFPYF